MPNPSHDQDASEDNLVKKLEPDFYWSALFAPAEHRPALLALYGFHAELDRIPGLVSEPLVGQMRLKWWRDVIEFAGPEHKTGHAAADDFARVIVARGLDKERLFAMVDARLADVYKEPPTDWAALELYYNETLGAVFETAALLFGAKPQDLSQLIALASLSFGIARSMQAFAYDTAQGRAAFPLAAFEAHSVTPDNVFSDEAHPGLKAAFAEFGEKARLAHEGARYLANALPRSQLVAFLPLVQTLPLLTKVLRPGFNPRQETVKLNPLGRFWRIWKAALQGSI